MMKRKDEDLQVMYNKALEIVSGINGLDKTYLYCGEVKLNGRLKRVLGRCFMSSGNIEVNKEYFYYASESDIMNTLLHEIAHRLNIGHNDSHGAQWQEIAGKISKASGLTITQYANNEKLEYRKSLDAYEVFRCECGHEHIMKLSKSNFKKSTPENIVKYFRCNCNAKLYHIHKENN